MSGFIPMASISTMPLLILFLIFFAICAILIFFILMQKGKGEGLAGLIGGVSASDGMGTPEAQKELSQYTKYLSIIFFFMCLLLSIISTRCGGPESILADDGMPPAERPPAEGPAPEDILPEIDIVGDEISPETVSPVEIDETAPEPVSASPEASAEIEETEPEPETASPEALTTAASPES